MENTSMLVTPFQLSGAEALRVAQEDEEDVWVSEVQVKGGCVPSLPPQGQHSRSVRQRARACSICITAQPIIKGSRFSG